jgi:predicted lipoprotein with Yx(FWY)xxD motif
MDARRIVVLVLFLAFAGCGRHSSSDDSRGTGNSPAPAGAPASDSATGGPDVGRAAPPGEVAPGSEESPPLGVATAPSLGAYVVDSAGRSLYVLDKDLAASACYDACATRWPALVLPPGNVAPVAPPLEAGRIGTFERRDGALQATYYERPLYLYTGDRNAGDHAGHGVDDEYGHWSLVGTDGKPLAQD